MGNNPAETVVILLLIGFVAYLVLKLYKIALGCVLMSVVTFVILALIYGVLWFFGLVS